MEHKHKLFCTAQNYVELALSLEQYTVPSYQVTMYVNNVVEDLEFAYLERSPNTIEHYTLWLDTEEMYCKYDPETKKRVCQVRDVFNAILNEIKEMEE